MMTLDNIVLTVVFVAIFFYVLYGVIRAGSVTASCRQTNCGSMQMPELHRMRASEL
jgi:hypothetical protein